MTASTPAVPSSPSIPLDRSALSKVPWERIHRARSWTQATVWGLEWEGHRLALKDFADSRSWLTRRLLGPWTIRKEARILRLLRRPTGEFSGAPRLHGIIEGPALLMERLPVKRLPKRRNHSLAPALFDELDGLIAEMHAAGVAHCDVRRKNIVLDGEGSPRLIDFTTAFTCPRGSLWPRTALFRRLAAIDRIAALRIRLSFFPDTPLTDEQRSLLANPPLILRLGRLYRQRIYRPFKKRVLRR